MLLTKLYVRFFRSFNFDYERKANRKAEAKHWEEIDGAWFPFVRVDLDPAVTAIVGANESGKSHLIAAIKQALTGSQIDRRDFCRYSSLFSVETGRMRLPDFGVEIRTEDEDDLSALAALKVTASVGETFTLIRFGGSRDVLISQVGDETPLDEQAVSALQALLPAPFELETDVPLPDSVSLDALLGRGPQPLGPRLRRFELIDLLRALPDVTADAVTAVVPQIHALLSDSQSQAETDRGITPSELGRQLLIDVAKIDESAFQDLENALRDGEEGRVGGLIEEMNRSLSRHLNFNRWWRQDRQFQLRLAPRERELVFTIRDRTGTDYSFGERSRGLMYFLSYFVQLRAHRQTSERRELLLMDEPDAYLSSVGQQDLLRALEHFARPDDGSRTDQVVYVTHSPFLINKNVAHRIRVLDKGSNEEGTRVVRDVARNHYEPLRSSIGSYVAETAFVGGTNLLVEGVSDQVLLAGFTSVFRRRGGAPRRLLDLNDVTIVPAGSASAVPYMAYLARGRDEMKPACVALLDGDDDGKAAIRKLRRSNDGSNKPILEDAYIVDVGEWSNGAQLTLAEGVRAEELEDLVPATAAVAAAQSYASRFVGVSKEQADALNVDALTQKLSETGNMWDGLALAFGAAYDGAHIDKVGFAKELVNLSEGSLDLPSPLPGYDALEQNFGALLAELADRLRVAGDDENERRIHRRTTRIVRSFLRDFPEGASRDAADQTLRELESSLDDSPGDEAVRLAVQGMRRDFELNTDPLTQVPEFEEFREALGQLATKRRLAYQGPADSDARPPQTRRSGRQASSSNPQKPRSAGTDQADAQAPGREATAAPQTEPSPTDTPPAQPASPAT